LKIIGQTSVVCRKAIRDDAGFQLDDLCVYAANLLRFGTARLSFIPRPLVKLVLGFPAFKHTTSQLKTVDEIFQHVGRELVSTIQTLFRNSTDRIRSFFYRVLSRTSDILTSFER
jgi:hypothetical protein